MSAVLRHSAACYPKHERALIAETIMRLADREQCTLILTTGGIGPALRDVTPGATMDICDRLLSDFREVAKTAWGWLVQDLSE